ncbi:ABC transporter substrate-binding protein [Jiangella alba]|uniref:Putative spermidine/putrescine transport system substrate-binding protein n=1 Tax=Jiangella alba TaxID=561176 RepID=A0A1H5PYB2_9ACTN|nr:ABC transporter substrate-binding protein [Jiangella alba]SEF18852.1 putative spermidine/putrescine transport system substrate-binding protein [Jiangella alba]
MKSRNLAVASIAGAAALLLAACGGGGDTAQTGGGDGGSVTFVAWGGNAQEAATKGWLEPFSEETGIQVVQDSPNDYAKFQQMVESGNVIWDVVQSGSDIGVVDDPNGILTEIDCTVVPCDELNGLFGAEKYGIPALVFSVVLGYNTEAFDQAPTSWADFFDVEAFPGKRAIYAKDASGGLQGLLDLALIQDGVPIDELYPLDVERALAKLETIKDHLIFYNDFAECTNLLATGEAVMANCYNGRIALAEEEGLPVGLVWSNQVQYADYMVVPKGAPAEENAMRLIAYMVDKDTSAQLGSFIAYGSPNPQASPDPDVADTLPTSNELSGADAPIRIDDAWWVENLEAVNQRWAEWKAQ